MRHLDHIWSCLHEHGDSAPRSTLYAPLSGSRLLWLELTAHLDLRVLVFCSSLLGREGERGGGKERGGIDVVISVVDVVLLRPALGGVGPSGWGLGESPERG